MCGTASETIFCCLPRWCLRVGLNINWYSIGFQMIFSGWIWMIYCHPIEQKAKVNASSTTVTFSWDMKQGMCLNHRCFWSSINVSSVACPLKTNGKLEKIAYKESRDPRSMRSTFIMGFTFVQITTHIIFRDTLYCEYIVVAKACCYWQWKAETKTTLAINIL